jgi:lipopolysaccharide export system protein LptA
MKTKEELKAAAKAALKNYPNAKKVFATLDGNVFLDKNRAELHAGKSTVIEFTTADFAKAAINKTSGKSSKKADPKTETKEAPAKAEGKKAPVKGETKTAPKADPAVEPETKE